MIFRRICRVVRGSAVNGGADADIVVTDTTKNQGTGQLATVEDRLLSVDQYAVLDAADVWLGSRPVPALGPGVTNALSTTLHIPPSTATGIVLRPREGGLGQPGHEGIETNNVRASGVIKIGPDLIVSAVAAPASAAAGATIERVGHHQEPGRRQRGRLHDALLLVDEHASRRVRPDHRQSVRSAPCGRSIGQLSARTLTLPAGTAAGTYYVIAQADAASEVPETTETNNNKVARP